MQRLDTVLMTAQMFAIFAIGYWSNGSRVALVALVVVTCLALARAVYAQRTGEATTGSPPWHWLLLACVSGLAWWFFRDGEMTSKVALILVAMSIAMAAVQAFRERRLPARRVESIR